MYASKSDIVNMAPFGVMVKAWRDAAVSQLAVMLLKMEIGIEKRNNI